MSGHLPALDGVRGLAILMVLLLHFVANVPPAGRLGHALGKVLIYGEYGVDLFFILSGFLITGILYDARRSDHYFRNFYMRRLVRIFPLYYGVLIALFFVAPLLVPLIPGVSGDQLADLRRHQGWLWLYGTNVFFTLRGDLALSYVNHFWSLAVEEHFYLVWPLVVWWLADRPAALMRCALGVALAALAARFAAHAMGVGHLPLYVLTPFRLDTLCLGGFLAVYGRQPGGLENLRRWIGPASVVAGVLLAVTFVLGRGEHADLARQMRAPLIVVLLAALLLYAILAPREGLTSRLFRSGSLGTLGKYSYGLYVYHHFISYYCVSHRTDLLLAEHVGTHLGAVLLQAVLGSALAFGVAYLSFELFEKRFLVLKRLWQS